MEIGQVISGTFGVIKARLGPLLGLWAIYFAITVVAFIAFTIVAGVGIGAAGMAGLTSAAEGNLGAVGAGMIVFIVLFYLGYILLAMAQYSSLIAMASPLQEPTVGSALSAGWRAAPALLLVTAALLFCYFVVALAFGLVSVALGEASVVLVVLAVPVLIWIGCRLAPLYAVVAVDGVRNPIAAVRRSWNLTQGYALKILLVSLVFLAILLVLCAILLLPSFGVLASLADPAGLDAANAAPAVVAMLLMFAGFLAVGVMFNVCYCAFMAVVHGTLVGASGEGAAETFD
jgi:hypothetical protein